MERGRTAAAAEVNPTTTTTTACTHPQLLAAADQQQLIIICLFLQHNSITEPVQLVLSPFVSDQSYNVRILLQTFCFRNAEAQMAETGFLVEGLQPGHNTRSVILKFLRFLLGGTNILGETHS